MTYALGIDLGTTYTGVAAGRPGQAEMVSLGDRSMVAPAVVFAREDGLLLTGEAAVRRGLENPDRMARGYKRRLGDPTPILLGGTPYSPAILLAAGLNAAVVKANEVNGEPAAQIVLTCPAVWGPYRREQFEEVPGLSGLSGVHLVSEPIAAASYYAAAKPHREGDVIAVYDLGGGTFDATVVRLLEGKPQILGEPEGVEWLGGIDFDEAVLGYVDSALDGAVTALDLTDPRQAAVLGRLRQDCTLAKEALSVDEEVTIRVFMPTGESSVHLSRATFEDSIRPALNSTIEALHRVFKSASLSPDEVSAVLLVGGSSRIPLVQHMIEAAIARPIVVDAHPKHAVALGAALIGADLLETPEASAKRAGRIPNRPGKGSAAAPGKAGAAGQIGQPAPDLVSDEQVPAKSQARRRVLPSAGQVLLGLLAATVLIAAGIFAGLYARGFFP